MRRCVLCGCWVLLAFQEEGGGAPADAPCLDRDRSQGYQTIHRCNYVSNPRKTARDRAASIARHRVNENHGDPLTPGALSRWLLWGESRSLARSTAAFRRRFRLQ